MTYENERLAANSYENQCRYRYGTDKVSYLTADYLKREAAEIDAIVKTGEMYRKDEITGEQYDAIYSAVKAYCKTGKRITAEQFDEIVRNIRANTPDLVA